MTPTHSRSAGLAGAAHACAALLLGAAPLPAQKGRFEQLPVEKEGFAGMTYEVFTPDGVTKGRLYPLVIALHGNGQTAARAARNLAQVSTAELPVFVVAPQYQQEAKFGAPVFPGAGAAFEWVLEKVLATRPVDPGRVVLQGFSMGSNYSTTWLDFRAKAESGGQPFCEVWLNGTAVPPRKPVLDLPFLLFVGEKETAVLGRINVVENVRTAYRTMFTRGMDVAYVEVPGMGHSVNADCHALMRRRLALLPDYGQALPRQHAAASAGARVRCLRGDLAGALRELDAMAGGNDTKARSAGRAARNQVFVFLRRHAQQVGRRPSLGACLELRRLAEALKDRSEVARVLQGAAEKMAGDAAVSRELAARERFLAAQALAPQKWEESLAGLRALGSGDLKETWYGRRARAHLQALGEAQREPLLGAPASGRRR